MGPRLKKQVDYWYVSGIKNWKTAEYLYIGKKYDAALFWGHLAIEKMLKGLVVWRTRKDAPRIHDLLKLAAVARIDLNEQQAEALNMFTAFNMAGRYDDEKLAFYKKCTKSFVEKNLKEGNKIIVWLKKQYPKTSTNK